MQNPLYGEAPCTATYRRKISPPTNFVKKKRRTTAKKNAQPLSIRPLKLCSLCYRNFSTRDTRVVGKHLNGEFTVHICDSERETATRLRLVQNDTSMTLSTCTLESTTRVRLRALSCFRDSVERERGGLAVTQNSTLMTYTASTVVFLCDRESLQRGARLDDPSLSLEERERDSRGERERRTLYSLRLERAPPPSEPSDGVHRTSVRNTGA
jgi:hypothetical protein